MDESGENPQTSEIKWSLFSGIAKLIAQVGCLTIGIIILFLLAGMWIDDRFETGPLFTTVLIIVSMPITMLAIYRWLRSSKSQMDSLSPDTKKVDQED